MNPAFEHKLHKLSALLFAMTLASCGGKGHGDGSSGNGTTFDHEDTVSGEATRFTRMGMDVDPEGHRVSGELGATVDASASITFMTGLTENQAYPYQFTFPSGLPGGAISNTSIFHTTLGAANKNIAILTPSLTKNVQNVLWMNNDNESIYGFASAGYLLNPARFDWPDKGIDTYRGKAFQYVVDSYHAGTEHGYALYISNVVATVDYESRSMQISIEPGKLGEGDIWGNSSMSDIDSSNVSALIKLENLNFTESFLEYGLLPNQKNGWGLGLDNFSTLNFFGANAQELAGIVEYSSVAPGSARSNPANSLTYQTISFALVKQ